MYPQILQIPFKYPSPSVINISASDLLLDLLLLCCKKEVIIQVSLCLAEQYTTLSFVLYTHSLHTTIQHKPTTEHMIFSTCAVLPP